jgi:hypothetical protein
MKKNLPIPTDNRLPAKKYPPTGNVPGLPAMIKDSMPPDMPRPNFKDGPISLFFGNVSRKQVATAVKLEAEIAEDSRKIVQAKLDSYHDFLTFSARTQNTFRTYDHMEFMRQVEKEQSGLRTRNMELQNENLELQNRKMEMETHKLQAEAMSAGWNAKEDEMNFKMREIQFNKMLEEMGNEPNDE